MNLKVFSVFHLTLNEPSLIVIGEDESLNCHGPSYWSDQNMIELGEVRGSDATSGKMAKRGNRKFWGMEIEVCKFLECNIYFQNIL